MTVWAIERGEEDFDEVLMTTLSLAKKENSDLWKDGYFERLRYKVWRICFKRYVIEFEQANHTRFVHFRKVRTV